MTIDPSSHNIPAKSHLLKLRISHAIVGKETDPLGKALDDFHKKCAAPATTLIDIPADLNKLCAAIKKFKAEYKSKHPKFIKSLETDVETKVNAFVKLCTSISKAPATISGYMTAIANSAKKFGDLLGNGLTPTTLTASIKNLTSQLETTVYGVLQIRNHALEIVEAGDKSAKWKSLIKTAEEAMQEMNAVNESIKKLTEDNYDKFQLGAAGDRIAKVVAKLSKATA